MFNKIFLNLVMMIHFFVVLFVIIVPFTNNTQLLVIHTISIPFLILHWITNNDICALTLLEQYIRKCIDDNYTPNNECYTAKIISPIYKFVDNNSDISLLIYSITLSMWSISSYKVYNQYKQHNNLFDLLIK